MSTLAELQQELTVYKTARDVILTSGQSYSAFGRTFQRGDLAEINRQIASLETKVMRFTYGSSIRPIFIQTR
jgi:hypothetical protein